MSLTHDTAIRMEDAEAEAVLLALGGGVPFTAKAEGMLYAAGWRPERNVDTAQVKADLEYWGYHWNTEAGTFLSRFLNLMPGNAEFDFIDREMDFIFDSEFVSRMETEFGKSLCPVGYFQRSDAGLLMAEDGTMYWAIDGNWGFFADDYTTALNKIFSGDTRLR